jgi:hypothetical protein
VLITLDVYVQVGCANCSYAQQLANTTAAAYPQVRVRVRDLACTSDVPDMVFAAPTYFLNDRVISLGNPDEAALHLLLEQALAEGQ